MLTEHSLPAMKAIFPDGRGIFQHNLGPCHTSKIMRLFFEHTKLPVPDWSRNSPDLSPIENLAIVKKRLQNCDCLTKTKLIAAIMQIWHHDEEFQNICPNFVDSMPTRISLLIKAKGGHIKY